MMPAPHPPRLAADPVAALAGWHCAAPLPVAVPDCTRPLDCRPALRALAAAMPQMGPVLVGLGLHRRLSAHERAQYAPFTVIEHDPDACASLGTVAGLPAGVHPAVVEAGGVIAVGVVELHQYAGVSGGHKAVAVGLGGRGTIAALHARDRVLQPGVELGRLHGNPFRAAIDAIGAAAGCCHALLCVPGAGPGGAPLWIFGRPEAAVAAGLRELRPWEPTDATYDEALLTVPASKGGSLYQASRAATYLGLSPAPPLRTGATLTIEAPLTEGLGSESGFVAALHSAKGDLERLLTGPEPVGAGAQRAVILALMARRFHLRLRGVSNPAPLRDLGLDAESSPARRGPDVLEVKEPFLRLPQAAEAPTFAREASGLRTSNTHSTSPLTRPAPGSAPSPRRNGG